MRLGCEMYDCPGTMLRQNCRDSILVSDIAVHKTMACVVRYGLEISQISCVGQLVEVYDRFVGCVEPVEHEVRANEAGPPSD